MQVSGYQKWLDRQRYREYWAQRDDEARDWGERFPVAQTLKAAHVKRITGPVDIWASDYDLRHLAEQRADHCIDWVCEQPGVLTFAAINDKLQSLEARPMVEQCGQPLEQQIQAAVKRLGCHLYWRRQLRRAQVRKREAQEQAAGHICAKGMPYVHDVTVSRHLERNRANRAMLEATEIENADGDTITLWQAVMASTANKAIRRGELMTRIRGSEEWATARGMVGLFTTNTVPSRFHASLFGGGINPNYDGSTPSDGQGWLCKTWARARAAIQRRKIKVFGFRVAEPHHDGCPHWHMLLWVDAAQAIKLQELMRGYWLQDAGDEQGAEEYRFKAERIDPARGGAVAYVAKYIAKNIDDFGAVGEEGHYDHHGAQQEIIEGGNKAQRVTAWASAWGIRQFQAIGQPPVTVWRELRRVEAGMAAGASPRLQRAHAAVHKGDTTRADWCAYMTEQGGAMVGRDYALRVHYDTETREGRYGAVEVALPRGVYDVERRGELCTSTRKQWKPAGTWSESERSTAKRGAFGDLAVWLFPTWTRFNNCTRTPAQVAASRRNSYADLIHRERKAEPLRS